MMYMHKYRNYFHSMPFLWTNACFFAISAQILITNNSITTIYLVIPEFYAKFALVIRIR